MLSQNQQKFFIEKATKKDSFFLQIEKVSGKEIQATDNIIFRLQKLVKTGNKNWTLLILLASADKNNLKKCRNKPNQNQNWKWKNSTVSKIQQIYVMM